MRRNEEAARMMHLSRYCSNCEQERLFEQFHVELAGCPDVADGDCQEWGCAVCGEAVIIGLPPLEVASTSNAIRAALTCSGGSALFLSQR
jgi:hypothetical protein